MFDIIAVGEILIDLVGTEGTCSFPGPWIKAPCNALAQAAKLRSRTAFIGMVGDDAFGRACAHQLDELKIRPHLSGRYPTGRYHALAFVTLDKNGDRDFTFYRRPGADTLLTVKTSPLAGLPKARVYLFGGVSLSQDPTRAAVFYSLFKLSGASVLRALTPISAPLWEDLDEAKALGRKAMGLWDILKLSSEEAVFFSGRQNPLDGARALQEEFRIPLVLMSMGSKGCSVFAARRLLPPRCNTNPVGGHHCRRRLLLRRIPAPVIAAFVLPLWTSFLPDRSSKPLNLPLPPRRLPSPAADRFLLCPYWRKSGGFDKRSISPFFQLRYAAEKAPIKAGAFFSIQKKW